jgi:hypothetical protein
MNNKKNLIIKLFKSLRGENSYAVFISGIQYAKSDNMNLMKIQ